MNEPEIVSSDDIQILDPGGALEAVQRAEVDIQIATAKRFPRSVRAFLDEAVEMATLDEETAASMFYVLPRGGKQIEGPSVRLAEVVASCWRNIRVDSNIEAIGDTHITAVGAAFDLERNVAARIRVKRRITDKRGKRYNDDMIGTTCNAATSIALREAVFKVVPRAFVKSIYDAAKAASVGKEKTMEQRRKGAFDWFQQQGIKPKVVLDYLGRKGPEDVTLDDLILLRGVRTAIMDGETTAERAFAKEDTASKAADLTSKIKEAGATGDKETSE